MTARKGGMMLKIRTILLCVMAVSSLLLFAGCSKEQAKAPVEETYLSVVDDNGRTVTLNKKPERIVALSASFLEPLEKVDASMVGRPSSKTGVPEELKKLDEVGPVYQINLEKVVALQPDLVIAYKGMHDKFVPALESNHIPVIVVEMKTYEEVKAKTALFASITGETEKGAALIDAMDKKIEAVQKKVPKEEKKIAILHSTTQQLTVQLDGSIAGSVAKMLGFTNVAAGSKPLEKNPDAAPYSMESLVQQNPEIIFVTSMGDLDSIKKSFMENVEKNPSWQSIPAVQKKHIYFLPQQLFLLNPGIHYPEAVETMADFVYPGVLPHGK